MFGYSTSLRWFICIAVINLGKGIPQSDSVTLSSEEEKIHISSLPSRVFDHSQTNGHSVSYADTKIKNKRSADFEEKSELSMEKTPDKRGDMNRFQKNYPSRNVGWWPWMNGITPVRRSSFIPRLGKRTEQITEFTPAEEQLINSYEASLNDEEGNVNNFFRSAEDDANFEDQPPERSLRSNFIPSLEKRTYSFSPRLGKRTYSFSPRLGKKTYSFSPRLGKRTYSFSPRLGKRDDEEKEILDFLKRAYSFSPRLG